MYDGSFEGTIYEHILDKIDDECYTLSILGTYCEIYTKDNEYYLYVPIEVNL